MTAAFGTRPKWRLNWVMDALNFEYPDYERFNEGAGGVKRKRVVSVLSRQAARLVKEMKRLWRKQKQRQSQRQQFSKKRRLDQKPSTEPKVDEAAEKKPSVADYCWSGWNYEGNDWFSAIQAAKSSGIGTDKIFT
jgi:hypothetical protein